MRRAFLAAVLVVAVSGKLFPQSAPAVGRGSTGSAAAFEAGLLARINTLRARRGLVPLRLSRTLDSAARHHANDMARAGFCSHDSGDGTSFQSRLARFYAGPSGWRFWSAGENVICHPRGLTAAGALGQWLRSPPHRSTLLSPRWREVGVAAAYGTSQGEDFVFVTADFGVRR